MEGTVRPAHEEGKHRMYTKEKYEELQSLRYVYTAYEPVVHQRYTVSCHVHDNRDEGNLHITTVPS